MKLYGLTGGAGSGKSLAGEFFQKHGIPVIDADAVGHALIAAGGEAESKVIGAFSEGILHDGIISREKLAKIVFTDAAARKRLNAIIHPLIFEGVQRRADAFAETGNEIVLMDAALLGEQGVLEPMLSGLILVLAPEALRIQRLSGIRGMSEADAKRRIAAQTPPEEKRNLAEYVIENKGSKADLFEQVAIISEKLMHNVL